MSWLRSNDHYIPRLTEPAMLLLAVATLLTACAVGPDFSPPEAPTGTAYTAPGTTVLPPAGAGAVQQRVALGESVAADWWSLFRSPELDQILTAALDGSPTLEAARATLAQARATAAAAGGGYYPQIDAGAGASRQDSGGEAGRAGNLFRIGPTVSYGPDLFGRTRRQVEQATALAQVSRYELAAAYLTLTGNAVTQALNIAAVRARTTAVQEIIGIDQQNLELVQIASQVGRSARTDVLAAETQLTRDQTQLPPLRQELSIARHALAVLAGRLPGEWSPPDMDLDSLALPETLPVTLPSALVHQRPDILAAEAQLHAASAAIGVATANLYPDLALSASWTLQSATTGALFDASSAIWSLGSSLTAPLFHGGTLEAQRRAAVEAFQSQLATYRATVLQAFGQVADVLRALEHDAELLAAQRKALDTSQESLHLVQASYSEGQSSLLQVLDAQRLFSEARLGYVLAQAQRYQDTAQLFAAMGGAWTAWTEPAMRVGQSSP